MKFDTIYTYAARKMLHVFATINNQPSETQQTDAEEADINFIMEKYQKTGMVQGVLQPGIYGDFTNVPDFKTAQEMLKEANDAFMAVPAKLRARFNNDPQEFIDFATNPENIAELRKLGLANPEPIIETQLPPNNDGDNKEPKK